MRLLGAELRGADLCAATSSAAARAASVLVAELGARCAILDDGLRGSTVASRLLGDELRLAEATALGAQLERAATERALAEQRKREHKSMFRSKVLLQTQERTSADLAAALRREGALATKCRRLERRVVELEQAAMDAPRVVHGGEQLEADARGTLLDMLGRCRELEGLLGLRAKQIAALLLTATQELENGGGGSDATVALVPAARARDDEGEVALAASQRENGRSLDDILCRARESTAPLGAPLKARKGYRGGTVIQSRGHALRLSTAASAPGQLLTRGGASRARVRPPFGAGPGLARPSTGCTAATPKPTLARSLDLKPVLGPLVIVPANLSGPSKAELASVGCLGG